MNDWIRLVPPNGAVEILGVKLVGVTADNGKKLLFTLAFLVAVHFLGKLLDWIAKLSTEGYANVKLRFWTRQAIRLLKTGLLLVGIVSIWFDDPTRLTTALGLVTAGLAFALQKAVTAVAGYFVILRSKTFNVGDRITMGGVRGDVIALNYFQTTIMEMGQPPAVQSADPAIWVRSRQYTGRIVTVTNDKIFDEPVYNYTRDFPYLWEEMTWPVAYRDDQAVAERILMEAAERHALPMSEVSEEALRELKRRYFVAEAGLGPRVYYRLTDNWVELCVRFLVHDRGIRDIKDAMSREILGRMKETGIGAASSTFEITGLPPLELRRAHSSSVTASKCDGN